MVIRKSVICVALATLVASLGGCASTGHPVEVAPVDVVGVWKSSGEGHVVRLAMTSDGKFESSDWPEDLFCNNVTPTSNAEVDWNRRIAIEGTWRIANDGQGTIRRISETDQCKGGGGSLHATAGASGIELWLYYSGAADKDDGAHIAFVRSK